MKRSGSLNKTTSNSSNYNYLKYSNSSQSFHTQRNNTSSIKVNKVHPSHYLKFQPINVLRKSVFDRQIKVIMSDMQIQSKEDIILDNEIKTRFFTYSIIDLYNRLFTNKPRGSFDNALRIFASFNARQQQLKEFVKPIIGSNEIMIYQPLEDRSIKIKVPLTKANHGYESFPNGCRHIFIENKLYICGGMDALNNPLNITLAYNINTNDIERIDNMVKSHAYHTLEYLDNYDCFIAVGGENNKVVELFDIYTSKWTRLPDLNFGRSFVNIYFDQFMSEVYALFGMNGTISNQFRKDYSDIIEVIELNDIESGWIHVDYYEGSQVNLKKEYLTTVPFTRTKLLIYGGMTPRESKKLFALYLMDKNEIMKADKKILEEIKIEEQKIKYINKSVSKVVQG